MAVKFMTLVQLVKYKHRLQRQRDVSSVHTMRDKNCKLQGAKEGMTVCGVTRP